jgi:hypothetical protein
MTLNEIRAAVDAGQTVHWSNQGYKVIKSKSGYLICCVLNNSCIGLTHRDGVTMNGEPDQFFVAEETI